MLDFDKYFCYTYWYDYRVPSLSCWCNGLLHPILLLDKSWITRINLIWLWHIVTFYPVLDSICQYLLIIFTSSSWRILVYLFLLIMSLYGIKSMLASYELQHIPSPFIFWKALYRIGIISYLNRTHQWTHLGLVLSVLKGC